MTYEKTVNFKNKPGQEIVYHIIEVQAFVMVNLANVLVWCPGLKKRYRRKL